MSLSDFIHPWFLSDKPKDPPPQTLYNGKRSTIPLSLAWSIGRFGLSPRIKDLPFMSNFISDIENLEDLPSDIRSLLIQYALLYILMILCCHSEDGLDKALLSINVPYTVREIASNTVKEFHRNLHEFYKNEKTRPVILKDIKDLVTQLQVSERALYLSQIHSFWMSAPPIPSYLTRTLNKRLRLAAFHPNYGAVAHRIQLIKTPHLYITPPRPNTNKIHPYLFENLLDPFPPIRTLLPQLKRFHDLLWKTHLYVFPTMIKTKFTDYNHRVMPFEFTPQEVFDQLLILQFQNWEQLWAYRKYPRTLETVRRIEYIRRVEKAHIPDVEEFLSILLSP